MRLLLPLLLLFKLYWTAAFHPSSLPLSRFSRTKEQHGSIVTKTTTTTTTLHVLFEDIPWFKSLRKSPTTTAASSSPDTTSRRDLIQSAIQANILGAAACSGLASKPAAATTTAATTTTSSTLLADLPMIRLKLPRNGLGKDYIATKICLSSGNGAAGDGDDQPVEFMIDSGLTLEMITPHLRDQLGLRSALTKLQGLTAGGANNAGTEMVDLKGAGFCLDTDGDGVTDSELRLPTLHAVVTDFPQAHMSDNDNVEGMLGLEVLSLFDVDFDFAAERIRLYQPGTAATTAVNGEQAKFVEIPAVVINDTGIIGIRVTSPSTSTQPVLGFIDCGSSFSVVNWKAAAVLGLPDQTNAAAYRQGPAIMAVGVDGRPIQLPTIPQQLSFAGEAVQQDKGRIVGFASPPSVWKPWDKINLAVGDLPVFPDLLGDGVRPYTGPAALIGLDVLAQRRFILEAAPTGKAANSRRRRLLVSAA